MGLMFQCVFSRCNICHCFFFASCLALVPGSTPESKRFVMIILQNNKTLSSSCYCYSLCWSTIQIHHHDSACLIHARPKFSEKINIYHHQTLVGCSVDHCSSCLLSVYLSLASHAPGDIWQDSLLLRSALPKRIEDEGDTPLIPEKLEPV